MSTLTDFGRKLPGAPGRGIEPRRPSESAAGGIQARIHTRTAAQASIRTRDRSVDLVRTVLLIVVVGLHSIMAGVGIGPTGIVLENALDHQAGFAPASWVLQVMPLFFILGGFSSFTQWTRMRERGHSPADYVITRLHRLLLPALAVIGTVTAALLVMTILGVPADLIATAGFRISQPLWFLGVYVLCSALVPVLVGAHERFPILSLVVLGSAALGVDILRAGMGIVGIGFINLMFVWLAVQQLGFWLADGRGESWSTRTRIIVGASALAALFLLSVPGPYSPDMYENLNPPTICLILLGIAQLMLFTLLRNWLREVADRPRISSLVNRLGARSMTIYLWHMPVIILLAAGLLILNLTVAVPLPDPLSAGWWLTRPVWLVAVGLAVIPMVAKLGRIEAAKRPAIREERTRALTLRVAAAVLLGAGSVLVILVTGFAVTGALLAVGMLVAALQLVGMLDVARLVTRLARLVNVPARLGARL
ncbi:peptidoglycan/LPS O-acetylase OafA/YrhL [Mycetocola sp. BIGb0189]|uniref:acyltransferase family protein n=1 Tax=Mycetocola sp. BIGb0189 TaxID=2940604 RepID=UPI0021681A20|nr:acyltransferase [Mycetocola sp. BIGb0189]MCS4275178.1 peptidoglycan/LPS O-acetylase OafA/YrhL [Mycetocola sp. BIGb0189]